MSLYPPPATIRAEPFARVPDKFRKQVRTAWADANKAGQVADCFLEGPSFDRAGNLWVTDIPHGRIFKISPSGDWSLVIEYDGWPNGLKFHKDGRAFITDYKRGIMVLDPATGKVAPLIETVRSESFKGVTICTSRRMAISISRTRARPGCMIRPGEFTVWRRTASSRVSSTPSPARMASCSICKRRSCSSLSHAPMPSGASR